MSQEELNNGLLESVAMGYIDYDSYAQGVTEKVNFRGKTLIEWKQDIGIPVVNQDMSIQELEYFNMRFITVNETVSNNLALARSAYDASRLHYVAAMCAAKSTINIEVTEQRNNGGKNRMPGAEILHEMAKSRCMNVYSAYKTSQMFYEFWKIHYDRLRLLDSRLTSMNHLKRYGDA
jgi:hypothetical protein